MQPKVTVPVNPPCEVKFKVKTADCPAVIVWPRAGAARTNPGGMGDTPMPESVTFDGLPAASWVTAMLAVRPPMPLGVNRRFSMQLAPGARTNAVMEQVLLAAREKSAAFAPERATPETFRSAPPVLDTVTEAMALVDPTGVSANARLGVDRLTTGPGEAASTPLPESATERGLPGALSVMTTEAVRAPAAPGVNVTLITQLLEADNWVSAAQVVPGAKAKSAA